MEKLRQLFHDEKISLRERMFRMFCTFIFLVSIVYTISGFITGIRLLETIILIIGNLILVACFMLSVKYGMGGGAIFITAVFLEFVFIPLMFFLSGGITGGAASWIVVGLIYLFMVFEGVTLFRFVGLTILTDVVCYLVAYRYPELVIELDKKGVRLFDSGSSAILLGLFTGVFFVIQRREYNYQKKRIENQQKKIDYSNRSRDKFYANFSHEIRNPINAIVGLNELTLRTATDKEIIDNSKGIKKSSRLLLSLVNDIIDLSQIQNESVKLVELQYSTEDYFRGLTDLVSQRAHEKGLELKVEVDPDIPAKLYGDEKRMTQIVLNLLTNAVKYTREGYVELRAEMLSKNEEDVDLRISVTDTGIGIKKENIGYLFDGYRQFDREINNSIEGNGLGLAITKELVALMGGDITVDSIYTRGSTFTVNIKQRYGGDEVLGKVDFLSAGAGDSSEEEYERAFEASEARLLIVDDDDINIQITKKLLKDTKMIMDEATSGKRALQMTAQKYYNVILLDYMMPDMNGVDTLRAIREQEGGRCKDSAIIALTGVEISSNNITDKGMGFNKIVNKPIDGVTLEKAIVDCLPPEYVEYRKDNVLEISQELVARNIRTHKRSVRITVDCTGDIPRNTAEDNDIDIMYSYIRKGDARFIDTLEVDSNNLSDYLVREDRKLCPEPPSVEEYEEFFGSQLSESQEVIHLCVGGRVMRNFANASRAAEGFAHVRVIDSNQVSGGLALLALQGAQWVRDGKTADEIYEDLSELRKYTDTNFIMPTPNKIRDNALLRPVQAGLFTLFRLRPVMHLSNNQLIVTMGMAGGIKAVIHKHIMYSMINKSRIAEDSAIIFEHVGLSPHQEEYARNELSGYFRDDKIMIHKASVSVASSMGMGMISLSYFRKNPFM